MLFSGLGLQIVWVLRMVLSFLRTERQKTLSKMHWEAALSTLDTLCFDIMIGLVLDARVFNRRVAAEDLLYCARLHEHPFHLAELFVEFCTLCVAPALPGALSNHFVKSFKSREFGCLFVPFCVLEFRCDLDAPHWK